MAKAHGLTIGWGGGTSSNQSDTKRGKRLPPRSKGEFFLPSCLGTKLRYLLFHTFRFEPKHCLGFQLADLGEWSVSIITRTRPCVTNPFLCKQIHKHTRTRSHVSINAPPTKPAGSASGEAYLTEGRALRKGKLGTTQAKAGTHKQTFFLKES